MRIQRLIMALACIVMLSACGLLEEDYVNYSETSAEAENDGNGTAALLCVSFEDVGPLLVTDCQSCHPGYEAEDYARANQASFVQTIVTQKTMPPSGWTDSQIAIVNNWYEGGTPSTAADLPSGCN